MDDDQKLEKAKYVYEQVNNWINNADNKVAVSCSVFTGIFGVITFLSEHFTQTSENALVNQCWACLYYQFLIGGFILLFVGLLFYLRALIPNLNSLGKHGEQKNYPIYFGDIQSCELKKYKELMKSGTEADFIDELVNDTYQNAGICFQKMKQLRVAMILSSLAICFSALSFVAKQLMYALA